MRSFLSFLLVAAALAPLVAGCGGDATAPDAAVDARADGGADAVADVDVTVIADAVADAEPPDDAPWMAAPTIVTASIGAAGGVVELGGFTLTIPPGALTETREITVEGAVDATVEGYSLSSRLYRLQPEGLTFALPATVSIPFVPGAESPALFWSLADNSGYEDLHGTVMGAAMAAAVTHFSGGYVGSVLPPE